MTPEERLSLLDSLLDGDISEADFLRIEAELSVDPEVRNQYYQRLQLDLLLEREAEEWSPSKIADEASDAKIGRGMFWAGLILAVAASMLGIVTLVPLGDKSRDAQAATEMNGGDELSASGFAVLSGQSGAVWESNPIPDGSVLPSGLHHLKAGMIHLELFSGVQMVIQGDAEFTVDSPMQVSMHHGRARAHVPEPAQGFEIKTAGGDVVDLGTEFAIDVNQDRSSVHVVDGEVELRPHASAMRRLHDGEAMKLTSKGLTEPESGGNLSMVGPLDFQTKLAQQQSNRFRLWKESSETLRADPRLIAYYKVDPKEGRSRQLANLAPGNGIDATGTLHPSDPIASEGAIVAADRTEDRWGRTDAALDFSRMGSRVRVTVPGEYRNLTLLCWVKINSLDRWYNSLFLTDGHEAGEPHWQILNDGRMFFSVKRQTDEPRRPGERQHRKFHSEPFWNTSLSGRWIMLCTVYHADDKEVTHYVDGNPISRESIPDESIVTPITIGAASICNWSQPMYRTDPTFAVRNLNGSLDEFALFSDALSPAEIMFLFRAGNPHDHSPQ